MAGRPPKHKFNSLKVGEKTLLTGRVKAYAHQYIHQYNKSGRKIKLVRDGDKVYAERTR